MLEISFASDFSEFLLSSGVSLTDSRAHLMAETTP